MNYNGEDIRRGDAIKMYDKWAQVVSVISDTVIAISFDNENTQFCGREDIVGHRNSWQHARKMLTEDEFKIYTIMEQYCHPLEFEDILAERPVSDGDAAKLAKIIHAMSDKGFIEFRATDMFKIEIFTFGHDIRENY